MRTVTELGCIVDGCTWTYVEPDPAAQIDGRGRSIEDIVERAMTAHATAVEAVVRDHLETHTVEEYARTIGRLRHIEQRAFRARGAWRLDHDLDVDQDRGGIAHYVLTGEI